MYDLDDRIGACNFKLMPAHGQPLASRPMVYFGSEE